MPASGYEKIGLKVGPNTVRGRLTVAGMILLLAPIAGKTAQADPGPLSHHHPKIIEVVEGETSGAAGAGYYVGFGPNIYLEVEFGGLGFAGENSKSMDQVRFFQVSTYLEQSSLQFGQPGTPLIGSVHFKIIPLAFNSEVNEQFSYSKELLPITYQREYDLGLNHSVRVSALGVSGEASSTNGWAIRAAAEALGLQMAAIHQDSLRLGAFLVATEFEVLKKKKLSKSLELEVTLLGLEHSLSESNSLLELFSRVSLNLKNGISIYAEANASSMRPGFRHPGAYGLSRDNSIVIAVSIPLF